MSAAKGILIRPSTQAFRVEVNFVDTSGSPVMTGAATCKVSEVQTDGTLRAVDFLTSPLAASVPTVKSLSTDVPTVATLTMTNQSCGGVARPFWSAAFPATNLTSGGVYLVEFQPPPGATTPNPKLIQYGKDDGDSAPNSSGQIALSSSGLDAVTVETGINARQALALAMDSVVSILSGAGGTTITVKNPANNANRIVATVDASGNRTAVTLTPPA